MRWWNWLLMASPPAIVVAFTAATQGIDWTGPLGATITIILLVGAFLIGSAGLVLAELHRVTRAVGGMIYSAACPFAMAFAALLAACAVGDCI